MKKKTLNNVRKKMSDYSYQNRYTGICLQTNM